MIPRWFGSSVSAFGAEDVGALDDAVEVDLARAAGERLDELGVEVAAAARDEQLEHAVDAVDDHPAAEPAERAPVVGLPAPPEPGDADDEERELDRRT